MAKLVKLTKGKHYTKGELGISKKEFKQSFCKTLNGEYFFVTIHNDDRLKNELQYDGLVIGVKKKKIPYGDKNCTTNQGRHIFVRFNENPTEYEYIGIEDYRIRYDENREKIFLQHITQLNHNVKKRAPVSQQSKKRGVKNKNIQK
jgi:hypothetical protein